MAIPFIATEISGLATQTYASGAINRGFLDEISGNLSSRIVSAKPVDNWSYVNDGAGITAWGNDTFAVSGTGGLTISVDWSTVASGTHIHDDRYYTETEADANFYPSTMGYGLSSNFNAFETDLGALSSNFQAHEADGTIHYAMGDITEVGTVTTGTIRQAALASGSEYWQAVLSGQANIYQSEGDLTDALDDNYYPSTAAASHVADDTIHFTSGQAKTYYDTLYEPAGTSGYQQISNGYASFAHSLGQKPVTVQVTPSGAVTFAYAVSSNASNIAVNTSTNNTVWIHWNAWK